MFLAWLTFISGVAISLVAIYYSVLGLAAIFAAAVIPIVIMGTTLEIAKLVTAWWLKSNWHRAPLSIKIYLLPAVVTLMLITSMGIFGFLSKAHTDQAVPLGDTVSQVAFIDEKINNERETIANARNLIKQLDDAVIGIQAAGNDREITARDGTKRTQSAAEQALQIRRAQAADRAALTRTIDEAQKRIVELQEQKAPIAVTLRAIEAEVGPIKYIARLIYGEDPDQNILEKAVVWVIIIIVLVFDPLAVLLLLASQMSFQWARQEQKTTKDIAIPEDTPPRIEPVVKMPVVDEDSRLVKTANDLISEIEKPQPEIELPPREITASSLATIVEEGDRKITDSAEESSKSKFQLLPDLEKELAKEKTALDEWNEMILEAERAAEIEKAKAADKEILESEELSSEIKEAMKKWKAEHPDNSLKHQRLLLEKGIIDQLPWERYLEAAPDFVDNEAAEEAAKWALEQLEESKKKGSDLDGDRGGPADQKIQTLVKGYIQNAEQNKDTLWQRVKNIKDGR
jgi:hypothetical protein